MYIFSIIVFTSSFCEAKTTLEKLVDRFKGLTKIQQKAFDEKHRGDRIHGKGVVSEVEESNTLDEVPGKYYKVIIEPQDTPGGNAYQIAFYYSDIKKVRRINKGREIRRTGKLLKITNWDSWISVWI